MAEEKVVAVGADHGDSDDGSTVDAWSDTASQSSRASQTTDASDANEKAEWEDWDEEVEGVFVSLFSPATFKTSREAWDHCKTAHKFDFRAIKREWGLDYYGSIKLINYIRQQVHDNPQAGSWDSPVFQAVKDNHSLIQDEKYMRPILEEDGMLFELNDGEESDFSDFEQRTPRSRSGSDASNLRKRLEISERRALVAEAKVLQLEAMVQDMRKLTTRLMNEKVAPSPVLATTSSSSKSAATPAPDDEPVSKELETQQKSNEIEDAGISQGYFTSYAHFGIHMSMLKDVVRTDSYRDAIYLNKNMFQDKVVLDIGCGTGILSMFAARSGAKKVIGIDRSDIVYKAQKIIQKNKLENVVTIIRGEVEKVTLPVEKVDIIISEWMGYFLLFESMLDTVLFARDKWLQPEGVVQPSRLQILISAADLEDYHSDNITFWHDVYGFDMDCMKDGVIKEAQIDVVPAKEIISSTSVLKDFDIGRTKKADQEFLSTFELEITESGRSCCAFVSYFDTHFSWGSSSSSSSSSSTPVFFSTGPHATPTHWKQTVFLLEEPIEGLEKGDKIKGSLACSRNMEYYRALEIHLEWKVEKGGVAGAASSQNFHLG